MRDVEIACTPKIAGPLTLGFRRRVLLVPADFMETAEAGDVEAALGHELAHIRRRDFAKNVLYELVSLPVSYHPTTRWLKAQVRQSRELVCDAMAAEFVTTREHYARSLLRLAVADCGPDAGCPRSRHRNLRCQHSGEESYESDGRRLRETRGLLRAGCVAVCVLVGFATCGSALALRLDVNEPPPASATAADHAVNVANSVMAGNRLGGENPTYPADARKAHVSGTVILSARISKDGTIADLQVISGPEALRQSAIDAVRTWRYKPFLLNGQPTEVKTTINVNYSLGG